MSPSVHIRKWLRHIYISEPSWKHSLSDPRVVHLPLPCIKIESVVGLGFIHSEINKDLEHYHLTCNVKNLIRSEEQLGLPLPSLGLVVYGWEGIATIVLTAAKET